MSEAITDNIERMKKSVSALKDDLNTIRTGRASASLFDKIRVDYYGDKSPLTQVATVSIPEARLVVIQPWDKGLIGEIEKAIQKSELSLNPSNDGKVIRIAIPPLTEERRKELVKQAKASAEQSRVAVRNIRRDGNEELKKLQKDGKMTEDDLKV
ncbi:MAG TPA: ribosome recycling factor, partial [Treponemataceae bacterium]|nr:ribosome recycling factor [Treponemataceae bacterium]